MRSRAHAPAGVGDAGALELWLGNAQRGTERTAQVTEMKKKEAVNEKLMFDIAQENKRLTEPLSRQLPPPRRRWPLHCRSHARMHARTHSLSRSRTHAHTHALIARTHTAGR